MKTNDIVLLFKGVSFRTDDIRQYIISLLQKFEVALLWDSDNLLIPSLLPTELDLIKNPALMRQVLVRSFYCYNFIARSHYWCFLFSALTLLVRFHLLILVFFKFLFSYSF